MGRKRKRRATRPPKVPSVAIEVGEEADRLFREAVASMEQVPVKDRVLDESEGKSGATAASPAERSGPSGPSGVMTIDLHHCTVLEAKARVDATLRPLISALQSGRVKDGRIRVQIITGKGRHSGPGGGILAREIHDYVRDHYGPYILDMEESPADLIVGELPIRGHFHLTLGKSR